MHANQLKILLVYNTAKYLYMLRLDLIRELQKNGMKVYAAVPYDDYVEKLSNENVKVHSWPIQGHRKNLFTELTSFFRLRDIIKTVSPDQIFNFTIKPVIYGSIAAKQVGVKDIFSMVPGKGYLFSNDSLIGKLLRNLVLPFYKSALSCNRKVFFQNKEDSQHFLDLNLISKNQSKIINGSGVNTKIFTPNVNKVPSARFVMVARLLKEKGVLEYFEAAVQLTKKYKNSEFVLIGPQSNSPNAIMPATIDSWKSCKNFRYIGEQENVKHYLIRSDIFVLPSYYNEGLPRSILEAMSCGLAIITTDWPGCKETVTEGKNGFLVPIKNCAILCDIMEKFIVQENLSQHMGIESRRIAKQKFDVSIINKEIITELIQPAS